MTLHRSNNFDSLRLVAALMMLVALLELGIRASRYLSNAVHAAMPG